MNVVNLDELLQSLIDLVGFFKMAVEHSPDLAREVEQLEQRLFDATDQLFSDCAIATKVGKLELMYDPLQNFILVKDDLVAFGRRLT